MVSRPFEIIPVENRRSISNKFKTTNYSHTVVLDYLSYRKLQHIMNTKQIWSKSNSDRCDLRKKTGRPMDSLTLLCCWNHSIVFFALKTMHIYQNISFRVGYIRTPTLSILSTKKKNCTGATCEKNLKVSTKNMQTIWVQHSTISSVSKGTY